MLWRPFSLSRHGVDSSEPLRNPDGLPARELDSLITLKDYALKINAISHEWS